MIQFLYLSACSVQYRDVVISIKTLMYIVLLCTYKYWSILIIFHLFTIFHSSVLAKVVQVPKICILYYFDKLIICK